MLIAAVKERVFVCHSEEQKFQRKRDWKKTGADEAGDACSVAEVF